MASTHYERLSAMDASFLASETATTPMHVAGLQIFESGPLRLPHGGIDVGRILSAYGAVLHQVPRYRQKLMWIPIENRPVWVDDPHFDLEWHIRHVSLPRPGGEAELKRVVSRLIANHLDRRRPMWEAWVIEGLEGDRFAILSKTHHSMIDGSAGVEIAQLLLSSSADEEPAAPEPWQSRPAPTPRELLRDELLHRAGLPLRLLRSLSAREDPAAALVRDYRAFEDFVDASMSASSDTPINGALGPHRRCDWLEMPLADLKAVRKALGCTINDVCLAIATQAFRDLLHDAGLALDEIVFRATTPVNLRDEDEHGTSGNRVASFFVTLPVGEADRIVQVEAIRAETERLKGSDQARGMSIAMATTDLLPPAILGLASSFASTAVNTIVTNVPGPQQPLYLQGARLEAMMPGVPLLEHIGLGIALMSYDGRVFWGLTADYDRVPDLSGFRERLVASFTELAERAGVVLSGNEPAHAQASVPAR